MAAYTYYLFFSIILVLGPALYLVNLIYFRMNNKTIFGQMYKPDTPEHKRVSALATYRNLTIWSSLVLFFITNLIYAVYRVAHSNNPTYTHAILIYAPVSTIIFATLMFFIVRKQLNNYPPGKRK